MAGSRSHGRLTPYARVILAASFVTTALVFGVWFSFAVFFVAMVEEFHWSRAGAAVACFWMATRRLALWQGCVARVD